MNQFNNLFEWMKRPKLASKAWISLKEIPRYIELVTWIARVDPLLVREFMMLDKRIRKLIKHSGFQFCFKYLKEALRLVIRFLAGQRTVGTLKGAPYIDVDGFGLPKILPAKLRLILREDWKSKQTLVACLLSVLSIFRVFPTHVKPSLSSVISEFNGVSKSIDLHLIDSALKDLLGNRKGYHELNKVKMIGGESAGPNGWKSVWSSPIDAVALLAYPKTYMKFIKYCYYNKFYWVLGWVITIQISSFLVGLPFVLVALRYLNIGKLGVVYDQAGKARIIAITLYWFQLVLAPLHNYLFSILKALDDFDGTFNQSKPLLRLKELDIKVFHSFDLTAATDRIPIDIQRDILNSLRKGLGTRWCDLLSSIPWKWKGDYIFYAVGQPMGALSSWAMLAMTHHVIVRVAALQCGIKSFTHYAILGDDIVIGNDDVALKYLHLMETLGVGINLNKSVISTDFAEFAKKWVGPKVNITPMGPGLILRSLRDVFFVGPLIREAINLNWLRTSDELLYAISNRWREKSRQFEMASWISLGIFGEHLISPGASDHPLTDRMLAPHYGRMFRMDDINDIRYHQNAIYNGLSAVIQMHAQQDMKKIEDDRKFFYQNWFRIFVTSNLSTRILEILLRLVSPSFWYYALFFEKEQNPVPFSKVDSWDNIRSLIHIDNRLDFRSIDWRERKKVKDADRSVRILKNIMCNAYDIQRFPGLFTLRERLLFNISPWSLKVRSTPLKVGNMRAIERPQKVSSVSEMFIWDKEGNRKVSVPVGPAKAAPLSFKINFKL